MGTSVRANRRNVRTTTLYGEAASCRCGSVSIDMLCLAPLLELFERPLIAIDLMVLSPVVFHTGHLVQDEML